MAGQIKALVRQVSDSASEASARRHRSYVDRPEGKGGSDLGPMGGELMLMGIGGCFMSNLLAAAKSRGIAVKDVEVAVAAMLDDGPPARFTAIELIVSGGGMERASLEDLAATAGKHCVSVNTIRGAVAVTIRAD